MVSLQEFERRQGGGQDRNNPEPSSESSTSEDDTASSGAPDDSSSFDVDSSYLTTYVIVAEGTVGLSTFRSVPTQFLVSTETTTVTAPSSDETTAPSSTSVTPTIPSNTDSALSTHTSTAAVITSDLSSRNSGLVAGISVVTVLLALAIGAIAFLVWKRRRSYSEEYGTGAASIPRRKEIDTSRGPSISSVEFRSLQTQLREKDTELQSTKAALAQTERRGSLFVLSDTQIRIRFARIEDAINDWVMTHCADFEPNESPTPEVIALLQRISPDYNALLRNPETKHLVLRAMIAEVIAQAFVTEQFLGDVTFAELKNTMKETSSPSDFNEWRALTVRMLSRTSSFVADRATTLEDIANKIYYRVLSLTSGKRLKRRLAHLQSIVDDAASLALDLAMQRALVIVERPGTGHAAFDAVKMEDMSGEEEDGDLEKEGEKNGERDARSRSMSGWNRRNVMLWVFPAVLRCGDESGKGYEKCTVVCKARVLLAG